jgi:uroporphyrinogen-III synthase
MRVVVTRPGAEAAEWVDALRARGFDAVSLPLIDIERVADTAPLRDAWAQIETFRAVMFVSANAVRGFFAARPADAAFATRAWATGEGTRTSLQAAGVAASAIDSPAPDAAQFDSEALWQEVAGQCGAGDRVLLVRGGEGRDWLQQQLVQEGVHTETVAAYARVRPAWSAAQMQLAAASASASWIFSSSQAITNLRETMPRQAWRDARAIATHPRIAEAARAAGFGVVCESRPAIAAVVAALESGG